MANLPKLEKEFIENLVQEPVEKFSVKRGSAKGDNVAGDIYAIEVHTLSNKTLNLVYKILPEENPDLKRYVIENFVFDLEINLYTVVAEKVHELVRAHGNPGAFPGPKAYLPTPKYFGGICDGESSYLVLEDERPSGYRMSNKYTGYNLSEVTVILRELARFHAFTYFLMRHEGEKFFSSSPGLHRYAKGFWNDNTNLENLEMMGALFTEAYTVGLKLIEEKIGDPELAARVRKKIPVEKVGKIARETGNRTDHEMFPVIVHGDFWTNNILLKYDPVTGAPVDTKFIDFQQIRRGNIYEDLIYFMFTSTTAEFRKRHLLQVLYIYYDSFVDNLSKLNSCPPPLHFSRGNFVDGFYKGYFPIYLYMLFAFPLQLGVPDEKEPRPSSLEATDEDSDNGSNSNFEKLFLSHPVAMKRLEELTREFAELGLF